MGYKNHNDYELLEASFENDEIALQILMDKYMPLIFLTASEYRQYLYQNQITEFMLDDFILLGKQTLICATKSYDDKIGVLFYTYFLRCLKSKFNTYCRSLMAKKNQPLFHYQSLDYEINDFCAVTSYLDDDPERSILYLDMQKALKNYLFSLNFEQHSILELRFNGFSYQEIESLLHVNRSLVTKTISTARKNLFKIIN